MRRLRRLVIPSISIVGNYEYASYWYLYQHGGIEFEMKATGIVNTVACQPVGRAAMETRSCPASWGRSKRLLQRYNRDPDGSGDPGSCMMRVGCSLMAMASRIASRLPRSRPRRSI